jgi:NAD(P)-dependent dehydrogenase (short-subunit alcohol dehydrogenase family)
MRLAEKVAIVTGSSSGIGRAIACLFAKEGAKIVVSADKNISGGGETVDMIKANNGDAFFVRCDVAKATDVEGLVKATVEKFGRVDILINNAGFLHTPTPFDEIEESMWDQVFAVNVKGIWFGAKYAAAEMKKCEGGAIVNIASLAAFSMPPYVAAYASSKGAAVTLTKALAIELAPHKIRVNSVTPFPTETPMYDKFPDEERRIVLENTPLGRMARPEEIAYAALYLASDESDIVTGTNINIDGGVTI